MPSVAAGYNVCIFAYGQTGSGKTHTMAGTNIEQYEGRGINYRALDDLFALNQKRQGEVSTLPWPMAMTVCIACCCNACIDRFAHSCNSMHFPQANT